MAQKKGFVKFDRNIGEWQWYTDLPTFKVFFHLVMFANFTDGKFLGKTIRRGQIARSQQTLANETGLTLKQVRTAINKLQKTGEIETEIVKRGHNGFSVYTLLNYNIYQTNDEGRAVERQLQGSCGAVEGQQYKNNKNNKKNKNNNNIVEQKLDRTLPYTEIVDYLNLKTNSNYKCNTKKTRDLIKARFNEGFSLDDFKKVINNKTEEWQGTDMQKFLRPETLFGNKFEGYLNQKQNKAKPKPNKSASNIIQPMTSGTDYGKLLGM